MRTELDEVFEARRPCSCSCSLLKTMTWLSGTGWRGGMAERVRAKEGDGERSEKGCKKSREREGRDLSGLFKLGAEGSKMNGCTVRVRFISVSLFLIADEILVLL